MTAVTGRRRIGKTKLILTSNEGQLYLYLFVSRSNEAQLCESFAQQATQTLGTFIPAGIKTFAALFELLMQYGRHQPFTLVIDEFQDFSYINPAVFSQMQDIWDRYKDSTHVNLVISGSVYTLMTKIFQDANNAFKTWSELEPEDRTTDKLLEMLSFDFFDFCRKFSL